jgi:hypothetical protein
MERKVCKLTGLYSNAPFEVEFQLFFSKSIADCCLWRGVMSFHLTPLRAVSPLRYLNCVVAYTPASVLGTLLPEVATLSLAVYRVPIRKAIV